MLILRAACVMRPWLRWPSCASCSMTTGSALATSCTLIGINTLLKKLMISMPYSTSSPARKNSFALAASKLFVIITNDKLCLSSHRNYSNLSSLWPIFPMPSAFATTAPSVRPLPTCEGRWRISIITCMTRAANGYCPIPS